MSHKDSAADKFKELRKDRLDRRILHDHLVGDACQVRDLKGDRPLRIDKGAEPVHDLAVYHLDRADLDDPVADRAESRRLNVKDDICILQRLIPCIYGDICQVVHHIAFHPVDHLEWIVWRQCLDIVVRIRERLCHAVVCDRDGGMSPVVRPLYNILYLGHAVHVAHLRMAVELHALCRAQVLSRNCEITDLFYSCHRADGELAVKFINGRHSLDLYENTLFQLAEDLRQLLVPRKHLDCDRIGKIRHRKHDDRLLITDLSRVKADDLPMDGDLSHLCHDLLKRDRLVVEAFAVDQIRVISRLDRTVEVLFPELFFAKFLFAASGFASAGMGSALPAGALLPTLLFSRCRSLFAPLHRTSLKDRVDLLLDPLLIILAVSVSFRLAVGDPDVRFDLKALLKDLVQKCQDLILPSLRNDRVGQPQVHHSALFKTDLCLRKHICRKDADCLQLLYDALPVFSHQRLRRILLRKFIFFFDPHFHRRFPEELVLDPLLHLPDLLLLDQMPAEYIYMEKITT